MKYYIWMGNERRLHNLVFLLELHALPHLGKITPAGFNDFARQGKGVNSARIAGILRELRTEKLVDGLELTLKGKEIFKNISSTLLYDPLYYKCVPFAGRYRENPLLVDEDIFANLLVKRSKAGEIIKLG